MHVARKRFGQHFLVDQVVIDAIVREIAPQPDQRMIEIGPGLGALTMPLISLLERLTVIELDRDLAARLRLQRKLDVVEADVLRVDFFALAKQGYDEGSAVQSRLRIVGNLPYNISSPLLFHLLRFASVIDDQHFMLQEEVVDRMLALPNSAAYGRMTVMLQWRYEMERLLAVRPESFDPAPRVNSAVVRMQPRAHPHVLSSRVLEDLARVAFSQRRKLLRHTLGRWLDQRGYAGAFDVQRRAEEVPVDEFLALAARLGDSENPA